MARSPRWSRSLRRSVERARGPWAAIGWFALLAALLVLPAYGDESDRILGGGELGGWLWRFWWMGTEIEALRSHVPDPWERFLHILSLGRFPETGNVFDLIALSWPLERLVGHPHHYNLKVFLILFTNGLAGWAYLRWRTGSRAAGLVAGTVLAANVFVFYEIQGSGLRQAILAPMALYCFAFERMLRDRTLGLAVATGVAFALTCAFYWFHGLFIFVWSLLALGGWLGSQRRGGRLSVLPSLSLAAGLGAALTWPFLLPYVSERFADADAARLPEVQWLADFPTLAALQGVPERPSTPAENLLSSLARVLGSSWPVDWLWNPIQLRVNPVMLALLAVGGGLALWRHNVMWLLVFVFFYALTWGPYLQWKGQFISLVGDEPVRLPYWYAFKYVPMLSRLFAPYRMGAMVIVALAVLAGVSWAALERRWLTTALRRRAALALAGALYFGQWFLDPPELMGIGSNRILPLRASQVTVPDWYRRLAEEPGRFGIIELPMDKQQDLLNYFQATHGKMLLGGWANPGALPPVLRHATPPSAADDDPTGTLQWLATSDRMTRNAFAQALSRMGREPYRLDVPPEPALSELVDGGFRYVIVHELGCYLTEPRWGPELYARLKEQLTAALGPPTWEGVELPASPAWMLEGRPPGTAWVPSIYSPLLIREPRPFDLSMTVWRLPKRSGGPETPVEPGAE